MRIRENNGVFELRLAVVPGSPHFSRREQSGRVAKRLNPVKPMKIQETMKTQRILKTTAIRAGLIMIIGAIQFALAPVSRAGLAVPYVVDPGTLHLWHCDETAGNQIFDAVSNNLQTVPMPMTAINGKTNPPVGDPTEFALLGQAAAFASLSSSIQTTQYAGFYGPFTIATNFDGTTNTSPAGDINDQDGVIVSPNVTNIDNYINPTTGAFTWEMLIQPSSDLLHLDHLQMLFGWDGGNSPWARAFQWRFYTSLSNGVSATRLYYQEISSGNGNPSPDPGQNATVWQAALPSTGPDAAVAGQWYHVALTFTGTAPTNGDTPDVLTMYWTALSSANTNCHVLRVMTKTNDLKGMVFPNIGGYTRANVWNNTSGGNGFEGSIDEVRISSVCRKANEMAFTNGVPTYAPYFPVEPPASELVGYGRTLTIGASIDASPTATVTWKQDGTVLPGQTNATLVVSNITFAANGNYQCFATNSVGGTNSTVCAVTVGAAMDELFGTGLDDNGQPRGGTDPGATDLHWFLVQNPDSSTPYPHALVWNAAYLPNAYYADQPSACWIGPYVPPNYARVAGTYEYETHFLVDQADVNTVTITGQPFLMTGMSGGGGPIQLFLNGVETDFTPNNSINGPMAPFTLTVTNGLVAGSNTLDLLVNCPAPGGNNDVALMLGLSGIGQALPAGLPVITNQPSDETVQLGDTASISAVALVRPPLSYQWLSNGVPVLGATKRSLTFTATNFGPSQVVGTNYTADYRVVVSNDSGSVTSSIATLTVTIPPLTIASAGMPIWNATNNEVNVVVTFSGPVDAATAETAGNYTLDNGASVLSATVVAPNEVVLATSVLNPATAYQLTVQNVKSSFGIAMESAATMVGIHPATTALWLKADTGVITDPGANTVNEWNDQSGYANDVFAYSGFEPQLVTNAVNGEPVIRFTGTNETYLFANSSPTLAITTNLSIFAVVDFATLAGGTNGMIVSKTTGNQPASYDYYASASAVSLLRGNGAASKAVTSTQLPTTGVAHVLDVVMAGTNVTHRLDGKANGSGGLVTAMQDNGDPLYLGTRGDAHNRLTGDLAELIIVGSAVSSYDIASMENYLGAKYDVPIVNLAPTNIVVSVSGNNQVTLRWPTDHTGWTLQAQTNDLSVGIGTNWVDVSNSSSTNQMVIPVNPTNPSVFYRLIYRR
jgi:Immunoglobulin domain/Concanavalin A-like lectin/glucanases superfamily